MKQSALSSFCWGENPSTCIALQVDTFSLGVPTLLCCREQPGVQLFLHPVGMNITHKGVHEGIPGLQSHKQMLAPVVPSGWPLAPALPCPPPWTCGFQGCPTGKGSPAKLRTGSREGCTLAHSLQQVLTLSPLSPTVTQPLSLGKSVFGKALQSKTSLFLAEEGSCHSSLGRLWAAACVTGH